MHINSSEVPPQRWTYKIRSRGGVHMPAQSKIDMLEKVNASLEAASGLFVIDYRGLTVKETQELRRNLREAGAEMKVR